MFKKITDWFKNKNNQDTTGILSGKVSPSELGNAMQESSQKITLKSPTQKNKDKSKRITLCARGIEFKIPLDQFDRMPESRLGKLKILIENSKGSNLTETLDDVCQKYDLKTNTFYFDRDPFVLNGILNYFNDGRLHVEEMCCGSSLSEDFEYWQIGDEYLDDCCREKYHQNIENVNEKIKDEEKIINKYVASLSFGTRFFPKLREKGHAIVNGNETWTSRVRKFVYNVRCGPPFSLF